MRLTIARAIVLISLGLSSTALATPDKKGCADHALFPTRMPDYYIVDCKTSEFDAYSFFVVKGPKHREEGKLTYIAYHVEKDKSEQSGVAVVRNYEAAIAKIGGSVVASDPQRWVVGKVTVDGKEVWFEAQKGNRAIWLRIIEKVAMKQHIVADAASFANDLNATGHVAVYGIHFDTGKAALKPESKPALDEVAKLLKDDASLKLWVVGHTDSVGKVEDNLRLAQLRAESVAMELGTAYGIAPARLKGFGVGPLAPVAGNGDEAGRAKNRRVELVKQP
jgi:outer membrane protein OmpA-like peptidoglycan-associated protein